MINIYVLLRYLQVKAGKKPGCTYDCCTKGWIRNIKEKSLDYD